MITVNGKTYEAAPGKSLLEFLRGIGVEVPTLCHDPRLEPYGGCRLCVVEVKGEPRPVTACTARAAEGMEVETHSPALEALRKTLLSLLARTHPRSAALDGPDKEFHRLLRAYGLKAEGPQAPEPDTRHPYIAVDMSRCVTCMRCARICAEVQGQFVWRAVARGDRTQLTWDKGASLLESSCVSCGACVDACPAGALEDRTLLRTAGPQAWTRTTCPYCGVGCELELGTREGRIVASRPVLGAAVNQGHLCVKGRYAFSFNHHPDRVTEPMLRDGGGPGGAWRKVSWGEALAFLSHRLQAILARDGPGAVGMLGSARSTNEENYLAQKFARAVLGTNNVDCCARVCHTPSAAALKGMLGTGAATNSFEDIEKAAALMVVGSNATENHPVVGARIKQRALKGVPLIVVDPRTTELARCAAVHLAPRPGTNIPLLNALAQVLVEERLYDGDFLSRRVEETGKFFGFIREWTPERAEALCGVSAQDIRKAARLYAANPPVMCFHGLGVTEHSQGTEGVMLLVNLALLTGNLGKAGCGVNPLRGQNNVQGSAHMGCDPGILTGSIPLERGRETFERAWGTAIPKAPGRNLVEMLDDAAQGKFKALWVMGYDVFLSHPDAHVTQKAFEAMDLVVVQDLFLNETAKAFAHVFLPAASSFEKDGTFMNSERRIQRVRKALPPPGEARADWEILRDMAAAMGKGGLFPYRQVEDIWDEVREVWPGARGITYERIEKEGLQWPCPGEDHPGTGILHRGVFANGGKAALKSVTFRPTGESIREEFPFLMTTGRCLEQFNAGTMTRRTLNLELRPTDFLDLNPGEAEKRGFRQGERVRVVSRWGEAVLPVRWDPAVKPGECFATFHDPAVFLNRITGPYRDRYVRTPEYKVTAVRIEKVEDGA